MKNSHLCITATLILLYAAAVANGDWYALRFDGVDDYVDCGNNPVFALNDAITLVAWVKTNDTTNGEFNSFITKGDHAYGLKSNTRDAIEFVIYDGMWVTAEYSVNSSFNGVWHHLAGVYDGSELKLYIDGEPVATTAHTGTIGSTSDDVYLGGNSETAGHFYEGLIDEVRIWNIARTQEEIQINMYALFDGNEPNLVGYWQLDEGTGQIASDSSGNGNHGQLGSTSGSDSADPAWVVSSASFETGLWITGHVPSGIVMNPVSYIDVTFSKDVNAVTFTLDDVNMVGPNGAIAGNPPLHQGANVWRVSFPEHSAEGLYYVYIGPHIEDSNGNEMDQDRDGIPGEYPDDRYEGTFTISRNTALQFDGVDDYVDLGNDLSLSISDHITISAWVKHNSGTPGQWEDIIMKGNTAYGFQLYNTSGEFTFHIHSGSWKNLKSDVVPEAGSWYHIAGTYDGNVQKVFINGVLNNTDYWSGTIDENSDHLTVGYKVAGDNSWFNGAIDEIRIWNIARIQEQIAAGMNRALVGQEAGLVGYWRFDEGAGQTASDSSGNRNDGQLGSTSGPDDNDPAWVVSAAPVRKEFWLTVYTPSGFVTNPVSYVDVTFSKDVNGPSFTVDDVNMMGPSGPISVNSPSYQGRNVWRVSFPEQSEEGEYHLYIGPDIEDSNGNKMDQDGDGIAGEVPDDIYDAIFTVVQGILFTSDTLIDVGDANYEGEDIVVSGCTLTVNGEHEFNTLHLINSGVVTHSAATDGQADYKVYLNIAGDVTVAAGCEISADAKGYGYDRGPGAGGYIFIRSGYVKRVRSGGGGYGGSGGIGEFSNVVYGAPYGSITQPNEPGSGGGHWNGGTGGGVVHLTIGGAFLLDGRITANGTNGTWSSYMDYSYSGGGGSGGSIYIGAETFTGQGLIAANGGAGAGGSGGGAGGRIAIHYNTNTFTGTSSAYGGSGYEYGGAGTIFTKSPTQIWGDLLVDNDDNLGATTPLLNNDWTFDAMEVVEKGNLEVPADVNLTLIPDVLTVDSNGQMIVRGQVLYEGDINGRFSLVELTSGGTLVLDDDGQISCGHAELSGGTLIINDSGRLDLQHVEVLSGGTLILNTLQAFPSMHIGPGGLLTHAQSVDGFDLRISADLTVDAGGSVSVDAKGYGVVSGPGAGGFGKVDALLATNLFGGGGGYGGTGGDSRGGATGGSVYGSLTEPTDWGSGGGLQCCGGVGGGAVRLAVGGTFLFNGEITANGTNGFYNYQPGSHRYGGGGSGGSVFVATETWAGSGTIVANGGQGAGGGGGGGRIAIYYNDDSFSGTISAAGGAGGGPGQPGTVFLGRDLPPMVSSDMAPRGQVRTPLDHIDFVFTRPIDPNTFTLEDIQLWGPDGEVFITSIALVNEFAGRQTYRISFPILVANGGYRLSIGPNITDEEGNLLDQDYDGVGGEAIDDVYEVRWTLDTIGPRIANHSPAGDIAGTVGYVDVWFSENLDTATFSLDDVNIVGPGGNITPTDLAEIGNSVFRITFDAQTMQGQYHVLIRPDVNDLAGNIMDQDDDGTQGEPNDDTYDASFYLADVDLTLSNVVVDPNELLAGEEVTVSWYGSNQSGMPLLGDWTDAVYLSADDQWDIEDELLATIPHSNGLAQDETYSRSVDVLVPGRIPGNYHIIVRTDLYNQEKEAGDEGNNIVAIGPLSLDVRELLADAVPVTGTLTDSNWLDYYEINTQDGNNLAIILDQLDPNASVDFFVSYERIPTVLDYDFRSSVNVQGNLQVTITGTLAGAYYVLVDGDQFVGPSSYDLMADTPEIVVTSINPDHHGVGSACTITIVGGGFDDSSTVEFIGSDDSIWAPSQIRVISPTTMTVDLDLPAWPQDAYDLIVAKPGVDPHEVVNAFEVTTAVPAILDARVVVPSALGRHWYATLWIEYANTGEASMPAPLFKLHGSDDAILTLDSSLAGRGLWTNTSPAGTSDTVQVMATGSGATPGILQPGDSGRIPVYYLGLKLPWDFSDGTVKFDLGVLTADGTEPINWASLKDEVRPKSILPDAWDAIWVNLTEQIGDTWGDYVAMLDENMNYLHTVGQDVSDVKSLLAFGIQQAQALSPFSYLAGAAELYSLAPGIPLTFSRVYGQSIDSRYEFGPLGRGWRHNWDIYIEEFPDGDVIVRGPLGIDRYFNRDSGGYTASPGDYGTLTLSDGKYNLTEKYGAVWQFRSDNLLDYVEDRNGNRITAGYATGQLISITHSNGDQLLFDYNGEGRIWHVTDPRGPGPEDDYVVIYEYDVSREHLVNANEPNNRVTRYTYNTGNGLQREHALLSVEYPDGRDVHFSYDAKGRLVETHRGGGVESVTYSYDPTGTVTVTDATGRQAVLYFGLGGQLAQLRDGEGNVIRLAYDRNYELTQLTGASGQQYNYSYDSLGNLTTIEDPLRRITALTHSSSFNDLTLVIDARNNGIDYDYDSSGNLTAITYEDGTTESFTYDASGNVLTWTNRRGDTVTYSYDSRGQLTSKDYSNTPEANDCTYVYDDAGNLISATDASSMIAMTYDPSTDWLTRIDYPGGYFFTFEYDNVGRRTQRTDQNDNVVKYIYDTVGQLGQMTDGNDALIVDYDYDAGGRLSRKTLGNGVYTNYEYDNAGRLTHLINHGSDASVISRFDYTYDASGRRTSITTLDGTYSYDYDPLDQLTDVTYPDGRIVEYVYDAVGNRIAVIDDAVATSYTTNNINQYTNVGEITYTCDADGNLQAKTEGGITTTYTYDVENRLVGVSTPTDTWTYTYDVFGNRISSSHNSVTTQYVVDPIGYGDVAAEYDNAGSLIATYDHGFGLLSRTDALGASAYYTFDVIGSTSELTDANGTILNTYAYDPFGISLSKLESIPNPFQYVGEYGAMHENHGLEFMRARFYEATTGRFITGDPLGIATGDVNFYRYVHNNPLNSIDPKGLDLWDFYDEYRKWSWKQTKKTLEDILKPPPATPLSEYEDLDYPEEDEEEGWRDPLRHALDDLIPILPPTEPMVGDRPLSELGKTPQKMPPELPDPCTTPVGDADTAVSQPVDPSDKLGPTGCGAARFVRGDDLLAYKIRFENESDATAPAHIINVTDTLDEDLDLSTFELTEISFANHIIIVPEGLNHYETTMNLVVENEFVSETELVVEIDVFLDMGLRELTFTMIGVDPNTGWLPEDIMVGMLYPNDDTGRGDGHISFTVKPIPGLPSGTEITNKATIKFDWEDPLLTPLVLNTIDAAPPVSQVNALPPEANDISILISWGGQDDANGSGIASYDIYVSDNGGAYILWLDDTNAISATFVGEHGHTYSFYSVATDNAGHVEEAPTVPDVIIALYDRTSPRVINAIVNESRPQRSTIGMLGIQFSEHLEVTKEILTLYNNTDGNYVDLSGLTESDFDYSESTYTTIWNVSGLILSDDNYTATILASAVIDTGGNQLDGNGDGTGGDDYTFDLFRLFGDFDGSESVDFIDFSAFAEKWRTTDCVEPYWCGGADCEPDGDVDFPDLAAFVQRWLEGVGQ